MQIRFWKPAAAGALLAMAVSLCAQAETPPVDPPDIATVSLGGLQADGRYDRFIIRYRDGTTAHASVAASLQGVNGALARSRLDQAANGRAAVSAGYQRRLATGSDLIRTSRKLDSKEAEALMRQIGSDPAVLNVAPDVLRRAERDIVAPATFTPNDTYYPYYQWHLKAPDGAITYFGDANRGGANIANAWDLADGTGITIAVLDTGITHHPDIDTSLGDAGYDFISDGFVSGRATDDRVSGGWDTGDWTTTEPWLSACTSASNPPSSSSWHGTHVASTAGAELTNNGLGMAGTAYHAKVLPIRVLGHCGGYDSDIVDAIVWAAGGHVDGVPDNAHPAQVINLSLGGGGRCKLHDPLEEATLVANALGAVVVVSAGNSNDDAYQYSPASCKDVITVAATGVTSRRAYYSNWGHAVEIAAPGGGVYTNDDPATGTVSYDGFVWQARNSGATVPAGYAYSGFAGTSQAAPHVAGTVALMQSARLAAGLPLLSPTQVLQVLQGTAKPPAIPVPPPRNRSIGAGIVDAQAAVAAAVGNVE